MNEIKINFDKLTCEERDQLMRLVKKGNRPNVWKPNEDDYGCYICGDGTVVKSYDLNISNEYYDMGSCFATREEAEEEAIRRKMVTRWKRLSIEAGECENPWDSYTAHWFVIFTPVSGVTYDYKFVHKSECTTFPSKESLNTAIAELGKENVKRYILRVRE